MKSLIEQLTARYEMTEPQINLVRPGLNSLAERSVTSIDDSKVRPIIEFCETVFDGQPRCRRN